MAQQTSPYIEAKYGWNYGESGWNSGMDENLLKFSYMFDGNIDAVVSSLPSPVNGTSYYLSTDKRIYYAVGTTWYSTSTPKWFTLKIKSTGVTFQYNGTTLVEVPNNTVLDNKITTVQTGLSSLGTASTKNTEFFASKAELDVASAQANSYTDSTVAPINTQLTSLTTTVNGKQPLDTTLTGLAGVTTSANSLVYSTGVDTFSTTSFTAFGRSLAGVADAAATRTLLGTTAYVVGSNTATTSGTSIDFTSVPAGTKRITLVFNLVSTAADSSILVQFGNTTPETTGYLSVVVRDTSKTTATAGATVCQLVAAENYFGTITISNLTGNTWVLSGVLGNIVTPLLMVSTATKTLPGILNMVRITTNNLTSFDNGSITTTYEG